MEYPQQQFAKAWELGLTNPHTPEFCGGLALDCLSGVIIAEELAYGCTGMMTAMEANNLASAPVLVAGTEEQQKVRICLLVSAPNLL